MMLYESKWRTIIQETKTFPKLFSTFKFNVSENCVEKIQCKINNLSDGTKIILFKKHNYEF